MHVQNRAKKRRCHDVPGQQNNDGRLFDGHDAFL
jgi:hypothetical protein